MIEWVFALFYFFLLLATGLTAFWATRKKSQSLRFGSEPITGITILVTVLIFFVGSMFGEDLKGSKWISATNKSSVRSFLPGRKLILRYNGSFVIHLSGADLGCSYSGFYQKINDTIILDKEMIDQTDDTLLTQKYYLKDKLFSPIIDTSIDKNKHDTFNITYIHQK